MSSEIFKGGEWSPGPDLSKGRSEANALLLQDKKVLFFGGIWGNTYRTDSYLYDFDTGLWSQTGNLARAKCMCGGVLTRSDGTRVALAIGGSDNLYSSNKVRIS